MCEHNINANNNIDLPVSDEDSTEMDIDSGKPDDFMENTADKVVTIKEKSKDENTEENTIDQIAHIEEKGKDENIGKKNNDESIEKAQKSVSQSPGNGLEVISKEKGLEHETKEEQYLKKGTTQDEHLTKVSKDNIEDGSLKSASSSDTEPSEIKESEGMEVEEPASTEINEESAGKDDENDEKRSHKYESFEEKRLSQTEEDEDNEVEHNMRVKDDKKVDQLTPATEGESQQQKDEPKVEAADNRELKLEAVVEGDKVCIYELYLKHQLRDDVKY